MGILPGKNTEVGCHARIFYVSRIGRVFCFVFTIRANWEAQTNYTPI